MRRAVLLAAVAGMAGHAVAAQSPIQTQPPPPAALARIGVDGAPLRLTLAEVVRRALENNTDVAIARLDADAAAEGVRAAQGAFDLRLAPHVSFQRAVNASASALGGATEGRVEQLAATAGVQVAGRAPWAGAAFTVDFSSSRLSTSNQFSRLNPQFPAALGVTYIQPLARNRSIDAERRAILLAQRAADLTGADLAQAVMDQLMLVEQAYWELVYAVRSLDVQIAALAQAQGQVASNERQAREGTLAPIDVVEAQTQVATFRQGVASAQLALTEAENRLKLLMLTDRRAPEWSQPLVPVEAVDREAPALDLGTVVAQALAQRPELRAVEAVRGQRDADRLYFQDRTKPQVDLAAGFTLAGLSGGALDATDETIPGFLVGSYGTSLGNLFARRFPTAVVALQVDWPLRNTTARANLARAEIGLQGAARRRLQVEQAIEAEVRNALQAVQSSRDRLAAAASASRNASEQYDSERRRFDSGLGTVFLVLERQAALVAAQARELRARTDLNQAVAFLDRASGNTLERHGVTVR